MNYLEMLDGYEKCGALTKQTLLDELHKVSSKYPDKIAAIDENRMITYKDLEQEISQFANGLLEHGIQKDDKVMLQIPNSIFYLEMLFAVMKMGAVPILLLQEHRENEIIAIGNETKATAFISAENEFVIDWDEMIGNAVNQLNSLKLVVTNTNALTVSKNMKCIHMDELRSKESKLEDACDYRQIAVCLLSGGTTGIPKIIPKLQESYLCNAKEAAKRCYFDSETVYLTALSASHDLALANPGVLGALLNGGTVVFAKSGAFDEAFELIEKYKVTVTCIVPALATMWVSALDFSDEDLSSLKHIIIGASKLDHSLGEQLIAKFHAKLQQGYGLGEGVTCFTRFEDDKEVCINTQGKPISEFDRVKIVKTDGMEVLLGEAGELLEKGPYTFGGYLGNPELNEQSFTEDGYFKTGDKAKMDEQGNIIILGRVREQINRAGENVIPAEVESYIKEHPCIEDACVFGLPDKKLGEKTVACVITKSAVNKKELCIWMNQKGISTFKFPDEVIKVNEFPYKNIGKVDKEALKKDILLEGSNAK